MGKNHRFKLSDMVPNAWFYKLKLDMDTTTNLPNNNNNNIDDDNNNNSYLPSTKKTRQHHAAAGASLPRKSYHFPRDLSPSLPDPPRKSSKQARSLTKSKNKPAAASSAPRKPVYGAEDDSGSPDSIFRLDRVLTPESLSSCGSRPVDPVDPVFDDPDIVIYVDENSFVRKPERTMGNRSFELSPNFELPRIVTKPAKPKHRNNIDHVEAEDSKKPTKKAGENRSRKSGSRRCSVSSSPRPRLRIRSPRLGSRITAQARRTGPGTGGSGPTSARKKLSGSFAVVKSSLDPKRDFRESMVEMIVEHNIKASKDLEELLACYLSLNADEYHELIIDVFTQIWFDLTGLRSGEGFR